MMMMPTVPPAMMMMMPDNPIAGVGEENAPCMPGAMGACNAMLSCATLPEPFSGVCGRSCATDMECTMENEVCSAYSMADTQGICINLVPAWDIYAFPETSACEANLTPVSISQTDQPYGLCLGLCLLEGQTDPPMGFPVDQLVTCDNGQECIDIGLTTDGGMMETVLGACGVGVDRGGDCDLNMGKVCSDLDDTCAPTDPNRLDGDTKCFQDCSMAGTTCDTGMCTEVKDPMSNNVLGAYCL